MDTNSSIPPQKKVVSVEILHLDEVGYGPQGKHTRREWRAECLENFLAGKDQFEQWQANWQSQIIEGLPRISLAATLIYDDGTQQTVLDQRYDISQPYTLDYVVHTFEANVNAYHKTFRCIAKFNGATFKGDAGFHFATFTGGGDFKSAKFDGEALFVSAMFVNAYAYFSHATFKGKALFNDVTFTGPVYFDSVTFNEITSFRGAKFCGVYAHFNNTIFNGMYTNFISATFPEVTEFIRATFRGETIFCNATFTADANFRSVKFESDCRFESDFNNYGNHWNKETSFAGKADFEKAEFANVGHFERVRFLKHTPAFRGCQIDNTRLEFSDDSYFPRNESNDDAVKNISFLKRLAEEHGQTDQALNFNAMELRAKRLQSEPKPASWSFRAITWLYEKIADYGRSFIRPLLAYLGLISITYILALIAAANNSPQDCKGELWRVFSDWRNNGYPSCISYELPDDKLKLNGYRAALEYTTYRAAGILDFSDNDKQTVAVSKRLFNADVEPTWMRLWGIFKAIASAALLFLAALGLRNKYRIK